MLNLHWYRELDLLQVSRPPGSEELLEVRDAVSGRTRCDVPAGLAEGWLGAGGGRFEGARLALATSASSAHVTLDPELAPGVRLVRAPEGVVLEGDWGRLTHLELQVVAWTDAAPSIARWQVVRDAQRSYEVLLPAPGGPRAWHELHVAGCAGDAQGPSFGAWVEPNHSRSGGRRPGLDALPQAAAIRADERTGALWDQLPAAVLAGFARLAPEGDEAPRLLERWVEAPEVVAGERHYARFAGLVATWPAPPRVWTARSLVIAAMAGRDAVVAWLAEAPVADVERALASLAARPEPDALAWAVERLGVVPSADPDELVALQRSSHELGLSAALRWLEEVAAGPGVAGWRFEPDGVARDGGLARRAAFASAAVLELVEKAAAAGPAVQLLAGEPAIAAAVERLQSGVARTRAALNEAAGPALAEITGAMSDACGALETGALELAVVRSGAAARAWMQRQAAAWRRKLDPQDGISRNIEEVLGRLEDALASTDDAVLVSAVALLGETEEALRGHASARFDAAMASLAELERALARLRSPQRERVAAPLAALLERPGWAAKSCPLSELVELLLARDEALGRADRRPPLASLMWLDDAGGLASEVAWAAGLEGELERLAGDAAARPATLHRLRTLRGRLAGRGGAAGLRVALLGQLALRLERFARSLPRALSAAVPAIPARRGGQEAAMAAWLDAALATAGARVPAEAWPLGPEARAELKRALERFALVPEARA